MDVLRQAGLATLIVLSYLVVLSLGLRGVVWFFDVTAGPSARDVEDE